MTTQVAPMPLITGAESCTVEAGVFFPDDYRNDREEVRHAKSLCSRCPLVRPCLAWALAHPALAYEGIWGGTSPGERKALRRELTRRLGEEEMSRHLRSEYAKPLAAAAN